MLVREAHLMYTTKRREDCDRKIVGSSDVARLARPWILGKMKEHFIVILLDVRHNYMCHEIVSIGSLDSCLVHPREVFTIPVREQAAYVLVVHNHPSGDCTPSKEDGVVTGRLKKAGDILGIDLLDHVILSDDSYYSFRDGGAL